MKKKSSVAFVIIAICFYIASAVRLYKGHDKMTKYSYSKNMYVGGDAYNYIINGNYATGFFVLSVGFLMTGTLFIGASAIIEAIPDDKIYNASKHETLEEIAEELPEL